MCEICCTRHHRITESQNHRMVGLEGTSVGHLVQPPCQSRLHRTLSRQVLNISREESTTSLGNLFQCSITLRGKKFFLMFRGNFLCFSLCPLSLLLLLGTTEKSLAPSSIIFTPRCNLIFHLLLKYQQVSDELNIPQWFELETVSLSKRLSEFASWFALAGLSLSFFQLSHFAMKCHLPFLEICF